MNSDASDTPETESFMDAPSAFEFFETAQMPLADRVPRLEKRVSDLTDALARFTTFYKKLLGIRKTETIEDAFDQMEMLLLETIEFAYAQLFLREEGGDLVSRRSLLPEGLAVDWSLVEWACQKQELAVIPVEEREADAPYQSILLLPLVGNVQTVGIFVLWVDFPSSDFTQEQSTLLTMLTRETASVVETNLFRQRLERQRSMISDVVETVPHGIMALDAEGRITLINSTMEYMLKVRRGDALQNHFGGSLPPTASSLLSRLLSENHGEERELKIDIAGVEEVFGLTATDMHSAMGERVGHVILCRDLKLSREVTKLREIDAMKNDFLSLVSHELRTPLTSIMAYTETLLMEGMVDTEEERREYLQIIYEEGDRLTRLINDVLDLTKMEAGKMEYVFEERDINEVIHQAVASTMPVAQQKSLKLTTDLAENLPPVRYDTDRIMQVLMNLLSNAVKFTEAGGAIDVRSHLSPPETGSSLPTVTVAVVDTGIGISPENVDRVFSKFEQVESIDHHSIGTGLGMPICKSIIEEGHGGRIWLESEVGKGTTFFFRIPVA